MIVIIFQWCSRVILCDLQLQANFCSVWIILTSRSLEVAWQRLTIFWGCFTYNVHLTRVRALKGWLNFWNLTTLSPIVNNLFTSSVFRRLLQDILSLWSILRLGRGNSFSYHQRIHFISCGRSLSAIGLWFMSKIIALVIGHLWTLTEELSSSRTNWKCWSTEHLQWLCG